MRLLSNSSLRVPRGGAPQSDSDNAMVVTPSTWVDREAWEHQRPLLGGGSAGGRRSEGTGAHQRSHPGSSSIGGRGSEGTDAHSEAFNVDTCFADGRQALLIDIGSVGNLARQKWVEQTVQLAVAAGKHPKRKKRETTAHSSGRRPRRTQVFLQL